MKNIIIFFSVLLILSTNSCENAFTTVKDIEIPQHNSKLAVFAKLDQNTGKFSVSYSKKINDNEKYKYLSAKIKLLENGNNFAEFNFVGQNQESYLPKTFFNTLTVGKEYTLIVENDELGTATSKQINPAKPNVNHLKYKIDGYLNRNGEVSDKLTLQINDDSKTDNFYMVQLLNLQIYQADTTEYAASIESEDPTINSVYYDNSNFLIISDRNFNGKSVDFIFNAGNFHSSDKIRVKVSAITKEYYYFLLSYSQYENSYDNPFAEPANVSNNIENGYGLFGLMNTVIYDVDIE